MQNKITIYNIFLFVFFAATMFYVKCNFQKLEREFVSLNRKLYVEQKNNQILKAEYSYLSNPERLAMLADKYLNCQQQTADNFDYSLYKKIYGQDSSVFRLANSGFSRNTAHN